MIQLSVCWDRRRAGLGQEVAREHELVVEPDPEVADTRAGREIERENGVDPDGQEVVPEAENARSGKEVGPATIDADHEAESTGKDPVHVIANVVLGPGSTVDGQDLVPNARAVETGVVAVTPESVSRNRIATRRNVDETSQDHVVAAPNQDRLRMDGRRIRNAPHTKVARKPCVA